MSTKMDSLSGLVASPDLAEATFKPRTNVERRSGWRLQIIFSSVVIFAAGIFLGSNLRLRSAPEPTPTHLQVLQRVRESVVELHRYREGQLAEYGSAVYLGDGYFITVKHALVPLDENPSAVSEVRVTIGGKELPASIVDTGTAKHQVDPGDWAIIQTEKVELPVLPRRLGHHFAFAESFFRVGNDYNRGLMPGEGLFGPMQDNGLVTAMADGHPGVSGGAVTDENGVFVALSIGRMTDDFRYSFLLPLREEMFRKIPQLSPH